MKSLETIVRELEVAHNSVVDAALDVATSGMVGMDVQGRVLVDSGMRFAKPCRRGAGQATTCTRRVAERLALREDQDGCREAAFLCGRAPMKIETQGAWSIYAGKFQVWHTIRVEEHGIEGISDLSTPSYYVDKETEVRPDGQRYSAFSLADRHGPLLWVRIRKGLLVRIAAKRFAIFRKGADVALGEVGEVFSKTDALSTARLLWGSGSYEAKEAA